MFRTTEVSESALRRQAHEIWSIHHFYPLLGKLYMLLLLIRSNQYNTTRMVNHLDVLWRWSRSIGDITQSEVSQKEKDKYYILMHIHMESIKMEWMNLFAGQQWRNRHREQTYGNGVWGGGAGEIYGESTMETYITVCKTDGQCGLLHNSGNSNRGSGST